MKTPLFHGSGRVVSVCRYAPGERHTPHTDPYSRISFVLRGGYREEGPDGVITMRPGDLLLKSCEALHEDVFGGVALVALEFKDDDPFPLSAGRRCWRKRRDAAGLRMALCMLEAALHGDGAALDAACTDLVATVGDEDARRPRPPVWLLQIRQELEEVSLGRVDMAARAREAGAHPAHASRLFRRCFGTSMTEYAQTHGVRRALERMAAPGATLSEAALAAGFYDQSHMNRVFRRVSGRSPGAFRELANRVLAVSG